MVGGEAVVKCCTFGTIITKATFVFFDTSFKISTSLSYVFTITTKTGDSIDTRPPTTLTDNRSVPDESLSHGVVRSMVEKNIIGT